MKKSIRNTITYLSLSALAYWLMIYFPQAQANPLKTATLIDLIPDETDGSNQATEKSLNVNAIPDWIQDQPNLNRTKRQLFLPRLSPLRSPIIPRLPRLRLPPPQPIILPLVTSTLSNQIRTYPYYLQEIPLALGETIMDSVREAAPHFTETLKEISPGIMEMINIIPEGSETKPVHQLMRKIPIVLHETMQEAMNPSTDYTETELDPDIQILDTRLRKLTKSQINQIDSSEGITKTMKRKINSKLEEQQKKKYRYQETYEDYEDSLPNIRTILTQNPFSPKKMVKKASSMSHTIAPVLSESLIGMAQLPQRIKDFVRQWK